MAGNSAGALKRAAANAGMTPEAFAARVEAGDKRCTSCKAWHPRAAFGADRSRADGLAAKCLKSLIVTTSGPTRAERRARKTVGEAWCKGCAAWHPIGDVHAGKCPQHQREAARAWYAENAADVAARKLARKRGLDPIPPWWASDLRTLDWAGQCAYGCGRPGATIDHVWPVARGGRSEPGNLVPACQRCNSQKKDHDPGPWVERGVAAFPDAWQQLAEHAHRMLCDEWVHAWMGDPEEDAT